MLLEVENLGVSFATEKGFLQATRSLSFNLQQGESLGIVGESGCGKSLTGLALMGLLPHTAILKADKLRFKDHDLLGLSEAKWRGIRGCDIAMIFQDPMSALNPSFTIGFQIEEVFKVHKPELDKRRRNEAILELLDQVGIPAARSRIHSYPHELSGGMCQRVMIAMAIACKPKLLIADEPTTALDVTIQSQIMHLLNQLQEKYHMAMILVSHDFGIIAQNADRVQVMYAGEIIESASVDTILDSPAHPYTQGLMDSLPGSNEIGKALSSIPGIVADLRKRPEGCQFHPRCSFAQDNCTVETPKDSHKGDHLFRCHYPLGGG